MARLELIDGGHRRARRRLHLGRPGRGPGRGSRETEEVDLLLHRRPPAAARRGRAARRRRRRCCATPSATWRCSSRARRAAGRRRARAARWSCRSAAPSTTGRRSSSAPGSRRRPARRSSCSAPPGRPRSARRVTRLLGDAGPARAAVRGHRGRAGRRRAGPRGHRRGGRRGAGLLVIGLSERWRRRASARRAPRSPRRRPRRSLFVRRGTRPGALAPRGDVTRFTWSSPGAAWPASRPGSRSPRRATARRVQPAGPSRARSSARRAATRCRARRRRARCARASRRARGPRRGARGRSRGRRRARVTVDGAVRALDLDAHALGLRVLGDVRQRLLHDAVDRALGLRLRAGLAPEREPASRRRARSRRSARPGARAPARGPSSSSAAGRSSAIRLRSESISTFVCIDRVADRRAQRLRRPGAQRRRQQHAQAAEPLQRLVVQLAGPAPPRLLVGGDRVAQPLARDRLRGDDRGGGAGRDRRRAGPRRPRRTRARPGGGRRPRARRRSRRGTRAG